MKKFISIASPFLCCLALLSGSVSFGSENKLPQKGTDVRMRSNNVAGEFNGTSSKNLNIAPKFGAGNQVCAGVNIHFTGGHEKDLDLIAAAGFKFIRMDFGWQSTEREKGIYNWSAYDELTSNLEKRGMRAIYILDYSNSLYEGRPMLRIRWMAKCKKEPPLRNILKALLHLHGGQPPQRFISRTKR